MEIREPKYKVGDKVTDIYGETYIICNILKYRFDYTNITQNCQLFFYFL